MTGVDVKRQAEKALWAAVGFVNSPHPLDLDPAKFPADTVKAALDALAPCIVLTAWEARRVARAIQDPKWLPDHDAALSLLTPEAIDDRR